MITLYKEFDYEGREGLFHRKYITEEESNEIKSQVIKDLNEILKKLGVEKGRIYHYDYGYRPMKIKFELNNEDFDAIINDFKDFDVLEKKNPKYLKIPDHIKIEIPEVNTTIYVDYKLELKKEKIAIEKYDKILTKKRTRDVPTINIEIENVFKKLKNGKFEETFEYRDKIVKELEERGYILEK